MKTIPAILIIALLFVAGCGINQIRGPMPTSPEATISVAIDSIPSGADVYMIENDGQLGRKIGTTPFTFTCGLAGQYWLRRGTNERIKLIANQRWHWGCGQWKWNKGNHIDLFLNIAFAKGNHSIAVTSKKLYASFWQTTLRDMNYSLTVPLKTIAQVNREMEMALRQQNLSRQQRITIQQQKDGLGTINSALDALIKYRGLRAY